MKGLRPRQLSAGSTGTPPVLIHAIDNDAVKVEDQQRAIRHGEGFKTGPLGFEPRNGGTKTRCLTTWRRPNARNRRSRRTADWCLNSYPQRSDLRQSIAAKRATKSGREDPQPTLTGLAKHIATQAIALHQIGLHTPNLLSAR